MAYTLTQTVNWAGTFVQYSPQLAGLGQEPGVSVASEIRSTILSAPFTWAFNRAETTLNLVAGTQDYTQTITDFGFLEKASLTDANGDIQEIKDVKNTEALSKSTKQQRPSAIAVLTRAAAGSVTFRFLGVPDATYTCTLTYQKLSPIMGPFFITSVAAASGANTTYTGVFDVTAFSAGAIATITGPSTAAAVNLGNFVVVSVSATTLVVANAAGVLATNQSIYVSNQSWSPLPDSYSYIFNTLYLGEILSMVDDPRAQQYRQRGVGALLSKAEGLSDMDKNIFRAQWLGRNIEAQTASLRAQQATMGRSV